MPLLQVYKGAFTAMHSRRRLIQVALDWTRAKDPPLSLGHASILANLKRHDIPMLEKSWAINHDAFDSKQVVAFAMEHAATETDFAIGAYIWNEKAVQQILKSLKTYRFPGRLIVGGPQVSYISDNAILEQLYPEADVFIRGYAENALLKLLQSSSRFGVIALPFFDGTDSAPSFHTLGNSKRLPI
ncbi:MAG: radical domain protein [Gammaproteobacteria bacterium]|nr:radical domain protein [Gammaproteobacteria bacterium]